MFLFGKDVDNLSGNSHIKYELKGFPEKDLVQMAGKSLRRDFSEIEWNSFREISSNLRDKEKGGA